jgi:hypothetical protein
VFLISVVNLSAEPDHEVQRVLRALNLQLQGDFSPYWHRPARLRLEGPGGRKPALEDPSSMRGHGVIYLWNRAEGEPDAVGYHERNHRGVPYGMVFLDIARELGEPWSVTLSHEALELAMDPEVNLLVQGPHPEDRSRLVYHWYEVCDAVQAQTYQIDGVAVSNFVLPLYFTEGEEKGARNDFLGAGVGSFGVAAGGYIGFFDPETGRHENYVPKGDATAARRMRARYRARWGRRALRHQQARSPASMLRLALCRGADEDLCEPRLESIAIDVRARPGEDPFDVLERAAPAALGADWSERFRAEEPTRLTQPRDLQEYELVPKGGLPAPGVAWDLVYALREQPGVLDAEPDFEILLPDPEALQELPEAARFGLVGERHLPETEPGPTNPDAHDWSVRMIRAREAWSLARGEGVLIAQPDTGYLEHPEIWPRQGRRPLDPARGHDFVDDDPDPRARPGREGPFGGEGHGTSVASVMVSPGLSQSTSEYQGWVTGVSPGATLVPLRVDRDVAHFSHRRLRRAIEYSVEHGFDLIVMGLGSPYPSRRLLRVVREARERGVILIAAAGNALPFHAVIWPARYPEVIGVAACDARAAPWGQSSRGAAIDVTAPGESVWRARVLPDGKPTVERGSGTSYAAAAVAGACALWLSHHGGASLRRRFGPRLGQVFRDVLRASARPSAALDPERFGAGVLDAAALLRGPLPRLAPGRRASRAPQRIDEPLSALFPTLDERTLREGLCALFRVSSRALDARLRLLCDELVFRLGTSPRLLRRFAAHCERAAGAPGARSARWRAESFGDLRRELARGASERLRAALEVREREDHDPLASGPSRAGRPRRR